MGLTVFRVVSWVAVSAGRLQPGRSRFCHSFVCAQLGAGTACKGEAGSPGVRAFCRVDGCTVVLHRDALNPAWFPNVPKSPLSSAGHTLPRATSRRTLMQRGGGRARHTCACLGRSGIHLAHGVSGKVTAVLSKERFLRRKTLG